MNTKKTSHNDEPNPEKIFQTFFAFTTTRVLVTGIDLEVFTHISNGKNNALEIAETTSTTPRGMEILLNSLASLDFLTKSNGTYNLTPLSEKFLVKGKASYFGDFVQHADLLWEPWSHLTEVMLTRRPAKKLETQHGPEFFEKMVLQLVPLSYPCAKAAAEAFGVGTTWKNLNVLDVAAGSGAWGAAFAESDPGTNVTAHDWPNVLEVTKKFLSKFNFDGRFSFLPGDLKDVDFGQNRYDLVILGHICHTEGAEKTRSLFSRAYRSLKSGGKLLIAEMIPDDERCKETFPLLSAVNMLINSTEGNTFTISEYRQWLHEAGYKNIDTLDVPGPSPLIVAIK